MERTGGRTTVARLCGGRLCFACCSRCWQRPGARPMIQGSTLKRPGLCVHACRQAETMACACAWMYGATISGEAAVSMRRGHQDPLLCAATCLVHVDARRVLKEQQQAVLAVLSRVCMGRRGRVRVHMIIVVVVSSIMPHRQLVGAWPAGAAAWRMCLHTHAARTDAPPPCQMDAKAQQKVHAWVSGCYVISGKYCCAPGSSYPCPRC